MPPAIVRGTPAYRSLARAMLVAGLATFALLYGVQPLLPVFATSYAVDAGQASLALSVATGAMAVCLIPAGILSDRIGRRPLMVGALVTSALFTIAAALAPNWPSLLAFRLLAGIALAGIPAVAMTYLAEELDPGAIGPAMGLYIAGNGLGGMLGRLGVSLLYDLLGWRQAIGAVGILGLIAAIAFWWLAPFSRRFVPRRDDPAAIGAGFRRLARDEALPWLFAEGFLIMGAFVTVYNYVGFRLSVPPFSLTQSAIGALFLLYVLGSASSAWFGRHAERWGRRKVLWIPLLLSAGGALLTMPASILSIVAGIGLITAGFFGAHSIVSSWIGRRAGSDRALASACYLAFYYLGGSLLGSLGGMAWTAGGWPGVVAFVGSLLALALGIAFWLTRVLPLPVPEVTPREELPPA